MPEMLLELLLLELRLLVEDTEGLPEGESDCCADLERSTVREAEKQLVGLSEGV